MKTNKLLKQTKKNLKGCDLDTLLDEISVMECDDMIDDFEKDQRMCQLNLLMKGWYAVTSDLGILAYFSAEKDAYRFRLEYINRILND